MSLELDKYLNFKPKNEEDYDEKSRLRSLVDPKELKDYREKEKDEYFIPENEIKDSIVEKISPSGKYKLTISKFNTPPSGWGYSQGKVYLSGSIEAMAVINRNYRVFPFLFIENHSNGHDYLICGEDYQGQTVIELDTGNRIDYFPDEAYDGHGFCTANFISFNRKYQLLMIDGCYWACPYEYRFYDFSNPMQSLNEIASVDSLSYDEYRDPTIESDGTIKIYQSDAEYVTDDNIDIEVDNKIPELASVITYKIENNSLIKVNEWVSEKETEIRNQREISNNEYQKLVNNYLTTDAIWLKLKELSVKEPFKSRDWHSVGCTYDGWCPDWKGDEKRFCKRIHEPETISKGYAIDIEIAHLSGPIKLIITKDGKYNDTLFFEHSIGGLVDAIEYSKKKLI